MRKKSLKKKTIKTKENNILKDNMKKILLLSLLITPLLLQGWWWSSPSPKETFEPTAENCTEKFVKLMQMFYLQGTIQKINEQLKKDQQEAMEWENFHLKRKNENFASTYSGRQAGLKQSESTLNQTLKEGREAFIKAAQAVQTCMEKNLLPEMSEHLKNQAKTAILFNKL